MKYVHRLRSPLEYEGKEYSEVVLNFDKLTGNDALAVEKEMKDEGIHFVHVDAYDGKYQIITAAKASGIPKDVLNALPLRENLAIKNVTRTYLTSGYTEIANKIKEKLTGMNGTVAEQIENELRAEGHVIVTDPATDSRYCIKLASKALDMTEDDISGMPMNEFTYMKLAIRFYVFGIELRKGKIGG